MKKIRVTDLRPGLAFDKPIYIDPDNVLVEASQNIEQADIDRLKKWGIQEVETEGNIIEEAAETAESKIKSAIRVSSPGSSSEKGISEEEKRILQYRYEEMQKKKSNFRNLVETAGKLLANNLRMLVEEQRFENQAVMKIAGEIADEVHSNKLILLSFEGMEVSMSQVIFHAIHAGTYGVLLASAKQYNTPKLHELMFSMMLMDSGMVRIPGQIKEKNESLDTGEQRHITKHPLLGYQLLVQHAKVRANVANVALYHHESFDGTGYPREIKGAQIEENVRIASIADSYTAMLEKRAYRNSFMPYEAMKYLLSVEMHRFDPKLLKEFLSLLSIYPVGSLVELSDKRIGLVLGCNPGKPMRPVMRILRDQDGKPYDHLVFENLAIRGDVFIQRALKPDESGINLDDEI